MVTILTMPRCRSAWLANFLDWGPSAAIHEPSQFAALHYEDLRARLDALPLDYAFVVDPSVPGPALDSWLTVFNGPVGIVERPLEDCWAACQRAFPNALREPLEAQAKALAQLGAPRLPHTDVTEEQPLRDFLAKLAPSLPFQAGRFHQLRGMRVTVIPSIRYGSWAR